MPTALNHHRKITARTISRIVLSTGAILIGGCAVGLDYEKPQTKAPDHFGESHAGPTTQPAPELDLTKWWNTFNDPELGSLIDRAVKSNYTMLQAEARVRQARAQLGVEWGTEFPTLSLNAQATRAQTRRIGSTASGGSFSGIGTSGAAASFSKLGRQTSLYQGGFDAGWEIDVFGGNRRAIESASDSLESDVEARRNTLVTLVAEVARDYVLLRGYQEQLKLTQDNVKSEQDTLQLTKSRFNAGLVSDLDVAQAEASVATTLAEEPTLKIEIRQTIHALSLLLSQEPMALSEELSIEKPIPPVPSEIPVGMPSELLRRRPDVRQAERALASATANIGVNVANLFPKFNLVGSAAQSSYHFSVIARDQASIWSIGPTVTWQILDYYQLQSTIRVANAQQEQALLAYKQTVLQSFTDVEDALVAYAQDQIRERALDDEVRANQRARDLSTQLYQRGLGDFLNVLTAERNLYSAQNDQSVSRSNVATDLVQLYKALGGGWDPNNEKDFQKFENPRIKVTQQ